MRIIALDSSGMVASVAVLEDGQLLAEYTTNYKKTHSQTLLPMLDEITHMTELDLHTIDAIAIAKGPGSFTGLRIGSATAKGLALALNKPIIEIPTLDGMAYTMYGVKDIICPMMDARRSQVYTGIYRFADTDGQYKLQILEPQCALAIEEIIDKCNAYNEKVVFLGDGVDAYKEQIESLCKVPYSFAPAHCNRQRAGAVGALAQEYFNRQEFVTAVEHAPEYLRLSQAERERKEKQKAAELEA